MKKTIALISLSLFLFQACGPKEKTVEEKRAENTQNAVNIARNKQLFIKGSSINSCVEFTEQNQSCRVKEVSVRTGKTEEGSGTCEIKSNSDKTYIAIICRKQDGSPCVGGIDIVSNESISSGELIFDASNLGSEIDVSSSTCSSFL